MPHVWVAYLELVNCRELSCVFLVPSLDRHICSSPFYADSCLFPTSVSLSFPSLSENSCMSMLHTNFHSPRLASPQLSPTLSLMFLFDLQLLESDLLIHLLLLFSLPKAGVCRNGPFSCFLIELSEKKKKLLFFLNHFSPLSDIVLLSNSWGRGVGKGSKNQLLHGFVN